MNRNVNVARRQNRDLCFGDFIYCLTFDENHNIRLDIIEHSIDLFSSLKKNDHSIEYEGNIWHNITQTPITLNALWWRISLNIKKMEILVSADYFRRCELFIKLESNKAIVTNSPRWVIRNSSRWNEDSLILLLVLKFIPPPNCLYEGWLKLPLGQIARIYLNLGKIEFATEYVLPNSPVIRYDDARNELLKKLNRALKPMMMDDHDIMGGLMSGGIDSMGLFELVLKNWPEKEFIALTFLRGCSEPKENILSVKNRVQKAGKTFELLSIDTMSSDYVELWLESLKDNIDYLHFGKPILLASMKRLAQLNVTSCITGQTADTVADFDLCMPGKIFKMLRFLYYPGLFPLVSKLPAIKYPQELSLIHI